MRDHKSFYTNGYTDGSGREYVLKDGKPFLAAVWGCSCCKDTVTPEHEATAAEVARKLAAFDDLLASAKSLVAAPVRYNDSTIEIDALSHGDAMKRVRDLRKAIAQYEGEPE